MTRQLQNSTSSAFAEYGDAQFSPTTMPAAPAIDMHRVLKTGDVPDGIDGRKLHGSIMDVASWLPFCAESYNISSDMRDYVLQPSLIFFTELPNANLCAFPFEEMSKWNVGAGCLSYQSWKKKPTFVEHANSDHTVAKGVIFDSSMRPAPEYVGGLHRVVLLNSWDRSRDPELARRVATGRTGVSMGSWVESYRCSVPGCGADINRVNGGMGCEHIHPKMGPRMPVVANKDGTKSLVYRVARGVTGFECSHVATPAFRQAVSEAIGEE